MLSTAAYDRDHRRHHRRDADGRRDRGRARLRHVAGPDVPPHPPAQRATRALPAYGNEVIFVLHGSSIASVVTLLDLTGVARVVASRFYSPYEAYIHSGPVLLRPDLHPGLAVPPARRRMLAHLHPVLSGS
ncbi:MAG: hypothetical protein U1E17_01580 [Geminicoccaceae bacterium]